MKPRDPERAYFGKPDVAMPLFEQVSCGTVEGHGELIVAEQAGNRIGIGEAICSGYQAPPAGKQFAGERATDGASILNGYSRSSLEDPCFTPTPSRAKTSPAKHFTSSLPIGDQTVPRLHEAGVGAAGEEGAANNGAGTVGPKPARLQQRESAALKGAGPSLPQKSRDYPTWGSGLSLKKAHARKTDPATSHAAAASVRGISATQKAILWLFSVYGEMPDELLIQRYANNRLYKGTFPKASESGIRSRRAELCRLGLVVDSGQRGKTAAGRECVIWRLQ